MATSHRKTARNLWRMIFDCNGSIWCSVLPYCILNCVIMAGVYLLVLLDIGIAFSPTGHGLMTLIISYLVINKVNMAYDRYMGCRDACQHAFSALRELHQTALVFAATHAESPKLFKIKGEDDDSAMSWIDQTGSQIIDLLDCTLRVIKDDDRADYLARNEVDEGEPDSIYYPEEDPMMHVEVLRMHLYGKTKDDFELMERNKLMDQLNEFVHYYRNLLKFASTPLPFPLVQMGRTFLFLWTFTIPLVLRGVLSEWYTAMAFVFFLTYGFIGLEVVSMKLLNPFGDGVNDLNVTGMKESVVIGMEKDWRLFGGNANMKDRRQEYRRQKPRLSAQADGKNNVDTTSGQWYHEDGHNARAYHAMDNLM